MFTAFLALIPLKAWPLPYIQPNAKRRGGLYAAT